MTKGKFGFRQGGGKHEPSPAASYVQIYVKSSALSRTDFVNDAITELEEIRLDAKKALAAAASH